MAAAFERNSADKDHMTTDQCQTTMTNVNYHLRAAASNLIIKLAAVSQYNSQMKTRVLLQNYISRPAHLQSVAFVSCQKKNRQIWQAGLHLGIVNIYMDKHMFAQFSNRLSNR
jgi:hypothetical protein